MKKWIIISIIISVLIIAAILIYLSSYFGKNTCTIFEVKDCDASCTTNNDCIMESCNCINANSHIIIPDNWVGKELCAQTPNCKCVNNECKDVVG